MIQRYSQVSDGKRYHAINRDPQGQWCKWEDVEHVIKAQEEAAAAANECIGRAEAYRNKVANACMEAGLAEPDVGDSFNSMLDNLLRQVAANAFAPKKDIVERLMKSADTLLKSNAPLSAHLCQEAADEIEYLRGQREQYNRLLEDTGGMRGRN